MKSFLYSCVYAAYLFAICAFIGWAIFHNHPAQAQEIVYCQKWGQPLGPIVIGRNGVCPPGYVPVNP